MKPEYWLSYNNGAEKLRLPVPPSVVSVTSPFSNTPVNIVNGGDFTIIGNRELKEYEFETFLPRDYNASYCDYADIPVPRTFVNWIERWRNTRKPIRFMITGTHINTPVTIEEFNYDLERAGEPGDIYFSMRLKEYKFLTLGKKVTVTKPTKPQSVRPPVVNKGAAIKAGSTYTTVKGDTLTKIAFVAYGKATEFRKIHNANKAVIGADPDKLKVGVKLVIPK